MSRGSRGAYRKEDRVQLPPELQKELVEKAAAKCGNCQELARRLDIPKSSLHYYQVCRLTLPTSVLEKMMDLANDDCLREEIALRGIEKDRSWATEHAQNVFHMMCMDRVKLPSIEDLRSDEETRMKAASILSYVMAEGSVWMLKEKWGEYAANITFASHETDLYAHFRSLCKDVFDYDIGPPQRAGNGANAIRGFIYSRFVAEWLLQNGVPAGDKAAVDVHLPTWVLACEDHRTIASALQPWCDGEGHVHRREGSCTPQGFTLSQSRHTNLDFEQVPHNLGWRGTGRTLCRGQARTRYYCGVNLEDYCLMLHKSTVLEEVNSLFRRLGYQPRRVLLSLYLKDDGYWSSNWGLIFRTNETRELIRTGLITQSTKVTQS